MEKHNQDILLTPYNPQETEKRIYTLWEESGFFNPDICIEKNIITDDATAFTIIMPPPNVTGVLHMGHAMMITLQDIMIRYKRMQGFKTLWLPGTDHAAIATQSKVEKEIQKKEGLSRHDLGREELLNRVHQFAKESHDIIVSQIKVMGASCDWSREAFTLDEKRTLAVNTMFKKMYDDGLIYRGHRIVNWDPKGQTTIADDEIVHEERKAKMYTFKYSADFPIAISTTRPETKVGDVAVAVHPEDVRYIQYIGKVYEVADFCGVPLKIKIIADDAVEKDFGTGALGVTPAHSMTDWEIADRHNITDRPQVINEYAKMTIGDERILNKKTTEAREVIVEWLKEQGLLENEEDITQNVSTAERTGGIIEPLPKLQWFIAVNKEIPGRDGLTLKDLMRAPVANKEIEIVPDYFNKTYFHWIDNLRDWCISRQIWYGHRVPVWYKDSEIYTGLEKPQGEGWIQDEDTLDTWFSSALWTFSTLGWPCNQEFFFDSTLINEIKETTITSSLRIHKKGFTVGETVVLKNTQTHEIFGYATISNIVETKLDESDVTRLQKYYPEKTLQIGDTAWKYDFTYKKDLDLNIYHPTDVLETGYEILFFWVARMILMTEYALDTVPFKTVYLNGTVRDGQGRKMSKSLGNGIDPIDITQRFGADAGRMSLIVGTAAGTDSKISEDKIKGYKHFTNKVWNITRFVTSNVQNNQSYHDSLILITNEKDQARLEEFKTLVKEVTLEIDQYKFHIASEKIYNYIWHTFADEIIEEAKIRFTNETDRSSIEALLSHILIQSLKLLHPFMPFVTEEIWSLLPIEDQKLLMVSTWPTYE